MLLLGDAGPWPVIAGLYVLTAMATMIIPTAALVVLMSPIVLSAMAEMGFAPETAMMAVAMAASASFTSPISHPANILVMGPGGYRFVDYIKVGVPLTLVVFVTVMILLPILWPVNAGESLSSRHDNRRTCCLPAFEVDMRLRGVLERITLIDVDGNDALEHHAEQFFRCRQELFPVRNEIEEDRSRNIQGMPLSQFGGRERVDRTGRIAKCHHDACGRRQSSDVMKVSLPTES